VALEFAILAVPLLILVLGTMEIGYDYFVQARLDNAMQTAARAVQVGSLVGKNGPGQGLKWVHDNVCPDLGGLLNCNNLYVSVTLVPGGTPSPDFYDYLSQNQNPNLSAVMSAQNIVCTGVAGQPVLAQAFYLGPAFLGALVPGFANVISGHLTHVSYATAGFINENFTGGQGGC
jgi:hypothetical protein